eukprot:4378344-Prymnesium_polylepis.1
MPGTAATYEWGRLVVQPLPRVREHSTQEHTQCCGGCGYALCVAGEEQLDDVVRCDRCDWKFHADHLTDDTVEPCFGPRGRAAAQAGERFCR